MAQFHGIKGSLTIKDGATDLVYLLSRWTLNVETDTVDVTVLGQTTDPVYRDHVAGPTNWSGTFEGFLSDASAEFLTPKLIDMSQKDIELIGRNNAATPVEVKWSGKCFASVSPDNDRFDASKFTGTFQGTGALAWPSGT